MKIMKMDSTHTVLVHLKLEHDDFELADVEDLTSGEFDI